LIDKFEE
jgi:hypothetical protein